MLTAILAKLPPAAWHRALRALGVDPDTFHEWVPGFCPCTRAAGQAVAA